MIGHVDIKTKSVHFYVQRNENFIPSNVIIPFQLARLNEGGAFDLASGIFTVPSPGIYHFDFSAVKTTSTISLDIYLQVNGANVGVAWTSQTAEGSYDSISLSTSLRLAAGDRVNLYKLYDGVLLDNMNHHTHFSGWLVEEDFM